MGKTVQEATRMAVQHNKGDMVKYKRSDLKSDVNKKLMMIKDPTQLTNIHTGKHKGFPTVIQIYTTFIEHKFITSAPSNLVAGIQIREFSTIHANPSHPVERIYAGRLIPFFLHLE